MIPSKRFLLPFSLLFLSAPFWKADQLTLFGRGLFIRTDVFVLFGLSILFVLLWQHYFPSRFLNALDRLFKWMNIHKRATGVIYLTFFFGLVIVINKNILHSFLNSADEHSCYFLAECLRLNKLWVDAPSLSEFFNVIHVGSLDGKWFSVYPVGWPLIWALGLSLRIVDYLNPAMATIALLFFFLAAKDTFGNAAARVGLVLISLTPFYLFNSASYFSHPTCLLMVSIFLFSFIKYLRAKSTSNQLVWVTIGALAAGYGLMTRYLTMAAILAPFVLYVIMNRIKEKKLRVSDFLFLLITGLSVLLILYQNWLVTGHPLLAPNTYARSHELLGFRPNYTPVDGLLIIISRFFYLTDWVSPLLIFIFCYVLFLKLGTNSLKRLFMWACFSPVIAYFFYYSWGGSQYGPRYYFEGLPFFGFFLGGGIVHWWKTGNLIVKKFVMGVVLASFISNAYLLYKHAEFFEAMSSQRKSLYSFAEKTIKNEAIVFIHGHLGKRLVLTQEDAVRNHPLLNTKIIYAHDLKDRNKDLMKLYPEREYYRGYYDGELLYPILQKI